MPSCSAYLQAHHLMMPILLLDLDNTLLEYNLDAFVREYLKALGEHIKQAPTAKVIQQVLSATQQMISKQTPDQTLEQCFDQFFYPGIGVDKEALTDRVELFYREVYPALRGNTTPRPAAKQIVEYGFEQGMPVVVATNPLFPRTATLQRLEWADLPATRYPFKLISTYESFHYAKPQTAYYAEILAQLGWLSQPAVMVGNSLEDDILPASRLGLPV
ncbi:MAG: HAD hydrolase-like protein, partial [Anaerolineaceae bacterium]|nr:HAD hydrolase-like protein [Anaerolineaceae bacterium]